MAVDWTEVRQKAYGRVEAELQRHIEAEKTNPQDFEDMTADEIVDQVLE